MPIIRAFLPLIIFTVVIGAVAILLLSAYFNGGWW